MIKWIRWQGLLAFFIAAGLITALWFLFVDRIVRTVIEKAGMSIVGAQVDVKVDVKLFPLGITLEDLQVTNPDAPETNSFECSRIAFNLDTLNLVRSKVIVNEMAVEGMRFDTKRRRPGKVSKKVKELQKKAEEERGTLFGLPIQAPDIKTILKNENLESVKLMESTRQDMEKVKTGWQQRIAEMPNRAKLDGYKSRIEKLKQAPGGDVFGMAGQLGEVRALRREIEQDIERVRNARTAFTTDLDNAKKILARAERAPFDDARRLRDKYSISPAGLANMTELLFGGQISSWVRSGLLWRQRLQPVVERVKAKKQDVTVVKPLRGRGVDVHFKEYHPLPDFLITRTAVSAETSAGLLAGLLRNITPDQDVLGIPLTFNFTGEKLTAAEAVAITGAFNHVVPVKPEDSARVAIKGFRVRDLALSAIKELPVAIQEGIVDFDLNGSFTHALKASFKADVSSAKLNIGGDAGANPFVNAVRTALSKVDRFSLAADIAGNLEDYKMKITSDLDRVLKTAVSSVVQEQSARLEQELNSAIQQRTGGQLKDLQNSFGVLNEQGLRLDTIQNQLDSLLQEALKSAGGGKFKLP
jgi:uncharacterized protein (TIGR03545 family)